MSTLAQTFPCLRNAPGIDPWDVNKLDEWASTPWPSHVEKCAAQFVLAVWNPDFKWKCGKFDIMEAMKVWDSATYNAYLVWAADPWSA
jgi:hypothetical protein